MTTLSHFHGTLCLLFLCLTLCIRTSLVTSQVYHRTKRCDALYHVLHAVRMGVKSTTGLSSRCCLPFVHDTCRFLPMPPCLHVPGVCFCSFLPLIHLLAFWRKARFWDSRGNPPYTSYQEWHVSFPWTNGMKIPKYASEVPYKGDLSLSIHMWFLFPQ